MTTPKQLSPSQELAQALTEFRAMLASDTVQSMASPEQSATTAMILDSCYAHAFQFAPGNATPATIREFLHKAATDCDQILAHLAALPSHAGWEPRAALETEFSPAHVAWSMASSYSAAFITYRMTNAIEGHPLLLSLLWTQMALHSLAKGLQLASNDFDSRPSDVAMQALAKIVTPLLICDFYSLAKVASADIAYTFRMGDGQKLLVGVKPGGTGLLSTIPGHEQETQAISNLMFCSPILQLEGTSWKEISYQDVLAFAA